MAELLALASAAAGVVALTKNLVGSGSGRGKKDPLYTLTPPAFDRTHTERALTLTPLEMYLGPRQRLFSRHFTGPAGERLLDARLHMAPPMVAGSAQPTHDFLARLSIPQPVKGQQQPGGAASSVRPFATARFHMQHGDCAHSYTDVTLKTEGGGSAFVTGAVNLSSAWERFHQRPGPVAVDAQKTAAATAILAARTQSIREGPKGLSAFYNLPLFGRGRPLPLLQQGEGLNAAAASAASNAFRAAAPVLRGAPSLGLRWDDPTASAVSGIGATSVGLHIDPQETLRLMRGGGGGGGLGDLKLGGWIAQETSSFRFAAEGTIAPMMRQQQAAAAAAVPASNAAAASVLSSSASAVSSGAPAVAVVSGPPRGSSLLSSHLPLLLESRFGLFYRDAPRPGVTRATHPNYEVGFTVANRSLGVGGASGAGGAAAAGSQQEFIASYFHHLNVRRNIHNPLEKKQNRSINNYIDLAMEVVYRNDCVPLAAGASPASASSSSSSSVAAAPAMSVALAPPSLRLGASWQLNKNSMLKFRVQDDNVSALYALKSWWDPSASAALSVNHSFGNRHTTFGLSLNLENIGEVLFNRPDPTYRRMIASQKENIENIVELDEDY